MELSEHKYDKCNNIVSKCEFPSANYWSGQPTFLGDNTYTGIHELRQLCKHKIHTIKWIALFTRASTIYYMSSTSSLTVSQLSVASKVAGYSYVVHILKY